MKIDAHQHYWAYAAADFPWIGSDMPVLQRDCSPADVTPAMQLAGVDAAIAVQARSRANETEYLLALARHHAQIVGVVGWTDLCASHAAELLQAYANEPLLKGFRHLLQDEADLAGLLARPAFGAGLAALQAQGLVYEVLVFEHQLPLVRDLCARHDRHWLVLDHVGKPALHAWQGHAPEAGWLQHLRALAAMPHVLCKLSGLVTETDWRQGPEAVARQEPAILTCFDRALECFGPGRILFGSDWPVCQLAAPYQTVHELAQHWAQSRLSVQEQAGFWGGNAARCYGVQARPVAA